MLAHSLSRQTLKPMRILSLTAALTLTLAASLPAHAEDVRPVVPGHLGSSPKSLVVIAADLEKRVRAGTVKKSVLNGWTVYQGTHPFILVSFVPTDVPAYPAATMAMPGDHDVLQCEGEKTACDELVYHLNHPHEVKIIEHKSQVRGIYKS